LAGGDVETGDVVAHLRAGGECRGDALVEGVLPGRHGVDVLRLAGEVDVHEACVLSHAADVIDEGGAGDAADERLDIGGDGGRQGFEQGEIADGDAAAGPQGAGDLAPHLRLVGREVDDAVGDDD